MSWHQQTDQIKHHGSLYLSSSSIQMWIVDNLTISSWLSCSLAERRSSHGQHKRNYTGCQTFCVTYLMPNVSECSVFASPLVAHAPPSRNHVPHHPFLLTLFPFDIVKVSHFPFHNAVLLPDFSSFLASQYISISHLSVSRYSLKISLTFE